MGKRRASQNRVISVSGNVGQPGVADGFGRIPTTHITFPVTLNNFLPGANPLKLKDGYVTFVNSGTSLIANGTTISLGTFGTAITITNGVYQFTITEDDFTIFWVLMGIIDPDLFVFLNGATLQFTVNFEV
jgi:hypothetical protein